MLDFKLSDILLEGNRCRRCGKKIKAHNLWCKSCRAYVDYELEGKANEPFSFYFEFYQWKKQKKVELGLSR